MVVSSDLCETEVVPRGVRRELVSREGIERERDSRVRVRPALHQGLGFGVWGLGVRQTGLPPPGPLSLPTLGLPPPTRVVLFGALGVHGRGTRTGWLGPSAARPASGFHVYTSLVRHDGSLGEFLD